MPHFSEASRPVIEITISRTVLHRCLVVVPLGLLLLLGVIGAVVSPMINEHPVLLTRECLALQTYLEEVQGWIQRLDGIAVRLDTLSPASTATANTVITNTSAISLSHIPTGSLPSQVNLPAQAPLSVFNTPASRPMNLFDRAQAAEHVIHELQAIERDMHQIETPAAFTGLHALAIEAVQGFAHWSTQVTDTIGAPTSDSIAAAQAARQAALIALENLRQALAWQQGSQP
jgi:hypothetical protein